MKQPRTLFGRRLREARTIQGISQKAVGIAAGLDPATASARMNQYEVGTHTPGFNTAARIAQVLGVPTAYFYAEQDDLALLILRLGGLSKKRSQKLAILIDQWG